MSSISSTGQGLYTYLQQISGANSTSQPATTPTVTSTDGTTATDPSTAASTASGGAVHRGGHHHHSGGGNHQLMQQIQSAVTGALQSAKTDGSSTDPNQIVEDAITKVLKNAGNASGAGAAGADPTATDPDGDGDTDAASGSAGQAAGADGSAKSAFFQSLQSMGIDPQQFHSDFAAAVKDAQAGGSADPSTAFQNFPPGMMVDTMG